MTKIQNYKLLDKTYFCGFPFMLLFGSLYIGIWNLPFDLAQGGEPVEPFVI